METQVVAIIDYGVGNLTSVKNALLMLNVSSIISSKSEDIESATHLILPGVGAFGSGMDGLRERGLVEVLQREVVDKKKKILGICLGMQLFATTGHEFGEHDGLGFIPGDVVKLSTTKSKERLPHMGWNDVAVSKSHRISSHFDHVPLFYFVHSYHVVPKEKGVIAGTTDYGDGEFVSMIEYENIQGVQFHPEKSHDDGLQIFRNFLEL